MGDSLNSFHAVIMYFISALSSLKGNHEHVLTKTKTIMCVSGFPTLPNFQSDPERFNI